MSLWKILEVLLIEANEELYQEGGEVIGVYIVCSQSVWQSWVHACGSEFRVINGSGLYLMGWDVMAGES